MPGSTRAALQDAQGVVGWNAVVANAETVATGGVPSVVPGLIGKNGYDLSQNLVVVNETSTPAGVTGE